VSTVQRIADPFIGEAETLNRGHGSAFLPCRQPVRIRRARCLHRSRSGERRRGPRLWESGLQAIGETLDGEGHTVLLMLRRARQAAPAGNITGERLGWGENEEVRPMTAAVTINVDQQTLIAIDDFAARMEQSREGLIKLALEEWLAAQAWEVAEIEAAISEADRGEFVSDEEIAKIVGKYGSRQ
jgi:predicted transcriptional regulator